MNLSPSSSHWTYCLVFGRTFPSLHFLPINTVHPKASTDSAVVCFSLCFQNCNYSAIPPKTQFLVTWAFLSLLLYLGWQAETRNSICIWERFQKGKERTSKKRSSKEKMRKTLTSWRKTESETKQSRWTQGKINKKGN